MSGTFPGVSVVITSYNYAQFIGRAIASACAQDAPGLEIVVVDNASTDGSWEVISAAAASDTRVRAFRNEANIGMVANHTRGLELATKPRALYLSADDYLLPGHISRVVAAHLEHPDVDYIFTAYVHVTEDDQLIRYLGHIGHPRGSYFGGRNEFSDLLTYDCYACTATTLFDREDLLRSGHDAAIIAGDYDLYLRLASSGARFGFIDKAGVALRIHASEITGEARYMATGKQLLDQLSIIEKHLTPANQFRIAGREQGVASLLMAKVGNLARYPDVAKEVMRQAQPRIDAVVAYLNDSRSQSLAAAIAPAPLVSVVLVTDDDLAATLRCIQALALQTYRNWELILVTNSTVDATPLLLDRARDIRVNAVHHAAPRNRAISLNDGLTLANGDIVAYADPESVWAPTFLEQLVKHYHGGGIDALIATSDFVPRAGPRMPKFYGSPLAQATIGVGEGVPLATFSHRRDLIDRFGRFDERLEQLADFEFIFRMFTRVRTGLDPNSSIAIHEGDPQRHAPLRDPITYLETLRSIYRDTDATPEVKHKREVHLATMTALLAPSAIEYHESGHVRVLTRGLVEIATA